MVGIIIIVILWAKLLLVRAASLSAPVVTGYELRRRAGTGDMDASDELDYAAALLDIRALRDGVVVVLEVAVVVLAVALYGWLGGGLLSLLLMLAAPFGRRLPVVCRWADRLVLAQRRRLLAAAHNLAPLTRLLRDREALSQPEPHIFSRDELAELVARSTGVLSRDEQARLAAGLAFSGKTVADIMTPRSVMETVDADDTVGPVLLDSLHKTGHSRFPVIDGDADHVVGVLYLHDLVEQRDGAVAVREAMQPRVFYVHQAQTLEHALHAFLRTKHHLFIVVNEYRETVGVLSLEDVIEALLGKKIVDEFDRFDDLRAVAAHNPRGNNLPHQRTDV